MKTEIQILYTKTGIIEIKFLEKNAFITKRY